MKYIKFSVPNISKLDIKSVGSVIQSGWLTHGKYTKLFEDEFKKFTKSKYCVTVSNCTAGLHLSCLATGFGKGDEVIVPSLTHVATAHSVEFTGAKAVFADVNKISGNLDLENIKEKISNKTKGIILVHMSGMPCEISKIMSFAKSKKIMVLEDCAHGLGTMYKKQHVGNFGITGSFSFYPTKQITTGEGGVVITNSKSVYLKIKKLKAFGIDKDIKERKKPGDYDVKSLGYNYRMTDFQAALGYRQIIKYPKNLKQRKSIAKQYIKNLIKNDKISIPPYSNNNSYFIFQIFCKNRDFIMKELKKNGVETSIHYKNPLTKMTYYKEKYKIKNDEYKNTNIYSDTVISLPVYPKMKKIDVDYICKLLNRLTR